MLVQGRATGARLKVTTSEQGDGSLTNSGGQWRTLSLTSKGPNWDAEWLVAKHRCVCPQTVCLSGQRPVGYCCPGAGPTELCQRQLERTVGQCHLGGDQSLAGAV